MTEYIIAPRDCPKVPSKEHIWDYENKCSPVVEINGRPITFSAVVCTRCKKKGMYLYERQPPYTSIFYVEKPT